MKKNVRHASCKDILEWSLRRNTVTKLDKLFAESKVKFLYLHQIARIILGQDCGFPNCKFESMTADVK